MSDLSALRYFGFTDDEVTHLLHLVHWNDLYDPFGVRDRLVAKLKAKERVEAGSDEESP